MRKSRLRNVIVGIIQGITLISGLLLIASSIKNYLDKKALQEKATAYLEEEYGTLDESVRDIAVYTEDTDKKRKQMLILLGTTGIGCLMLWLLRKK